MATLDQTIKIVLMAVDETGGAFSTASAGIDQLTEKVGSITGPLSAATDAIIKMDAAALAVGITFGTLAVRETIKFQDSLYLVQKQLGETGPSIQQAREDIESLALAFGLNANAVAESLAGFLAAGYSYETAAKLVRTSTELVIAGDLEAVKATDYLNAAMAGFRIPAEQAAAGAQQVGDILNKLADISSSRTLDPIAEAFARVAPVAATAGLTMEETGAIVARLVDVFQDGSIAGTALSSGLNTLADPSREAAALLAEVGVQTTDASGVLRQSGDILRDLAGKWGTLTSAEQTQAATVIFGKEQAAKFQVVLGDWTKIQEYLNQVLDESTGAVGSMAREVEGKMALISTSVDRTSEAWRQFLERVGAQITDDGSLQGLISNVGLLGEAFKAVVASGGLDPLIDLLQSQFASLSDAVAKIAANLPAAFEGIDFSGLISSFGSLSDEFGGLFDGVDLTTVDGLRKAIQAVVDTGETLVRVTAGIVDGLTPFIRGLVSVVDEINSSDAATKEWAGEILGIAKGINSLLPILGSLGDGLGAVGSGLEAIAAASVVKTLASVESAAVKTAASLAGSAGLVGAAGAAGYAVGTVLNEGISAVVETATGTEGATLGTWLYDITHASEDLALTAPTAATALGKEADATADMSKAAETAAPALELMSKEQLDAALSAEKGGEALLALGEAATPMTASLVKAGAAVGDAGDQTETLTTKTGRVVNILRDANGQIVGYEQAVGGASKQLEEAAKKTEEATKKTEDFLIKMEEIASNERIKNIEASVKLNIAELEADTERAKAAFESIDNSISSTGTLLSSLFGELSGATGLDKLEILDQIEKENELRQQSFELQQKLAEAEIARIEAQVRAMERGDTAIKIDGTGLEPELEAFMWAILKKIRVRANAEFSDYLLGLAA